MIKFREFIKEEETLIRINILNNFAAKSINLSHRQPFRE